MTCSQGAYLQEPNRTKRLACGQNDRLIFGMAQMQGWRATQEDAHNCLIDFDKNASFFAVYDGHGGSEVSRFASMKLPEEIHKSRHWSLNEIEKSLIDGFLHFDQTLIHNVNYRTLRSLRSVEEVEFYQSWLNKNQLRSATVGQKAHQRHRDHALVTASNSSSLSISKLDKPASHRLMKKRSTIGMMFSSLDISDREPVALDNGEKYAKSGPHDTNEMYADALSDHDWTPGYQSGSTSCVTIIDQNTIYVASIGDSGCVLCRNGKAVLLSKEHKPDDSKEKQRIIAAGGYLDKDGRVNGILNLSRSFGDFGGKQNPNLSVNEQIIIALPDVQTVRLQKEDRFAVLACDGIWNSLTGQELVDLISQRLSKGLTPTQVCEEICDLCLSPTCNGLDDTGCDNMTIIIVQFKALR